LLILPALFGPTEFHVFLFAVTAFSFALNTSVAAYSPAPFVRPGDSYRPLKTVRPILGAAFRLILRFHVRFMAKYRATFGSSCQFRLCSSARRKPKTGAVLVRARFRLRCAPGIDSASLRSTPRRYETNESPTKPEEEKQSTHTCHRKRSDHGHPKAHPLLAAPECEFHTQRGLCRASSYL
jgi:hypothetical protein